jgi:hypothetical protein
MDGDRISFDDSVSRRMALFGTAALGSTFALAVQPVQAQTMITTPADGLTAGVVKVKTTDGTGGGRLEEDARLVQGQRRHLIGRSWKARA